MHDWLKCYIDFNDKKCVFYFNNFLNVLIFPFTRVNSQIDQLQKDSFRRINGRKLVSEFLIWAQKWVKISPQKKGNFCVFATHC